MISSKTIPHGAGRTAPVRSRLALLVTSGLLCVSPCHGQAPAKPVPPPRPSPPEMASLPAEQAKKLGDIPGQVSWTNVSPDGSTIHMNGRKGSRHAVFVNGEAKQLYDEIVTKLQEINVPAFTTDGSTSLFIGRRGTAFHLVANGVESAPFDKILAFWLPPTGGGYTMMALRENRVVLHQDGKDLPPPPGLVGEPDRNFFGVVLQGAGYDPEGKRFVYLASRVDPKAKKAVLQWVLDNRALPAFEGFASDVVLHWTYGPGNTYAYVETAVGGLNNQVKTHFVNFNGKKGPGYSSINDLSISADGKHVAYVAHRMPTEQEIDTVVPKMEGESDADYKKRRSALDVQAYSSDARRRMAGIESVTRVVLDHKELPTTGDLRDIARETVMGPDGRIAAVYECWWEHGKRRQTAAWKVAADGKVSMEYDSHLTTRFSPDGQTAVSIVSKGQGQYVLMNAEETDAEYHGIDVKQLGFSADGKTPSFPARTADGKPVYVTGGNAEDGSGLRLRSADGKREARIVARGNHPRTSQALHNLLIDGKTHEIPGEVIEVMFSPDGSSLACTYRPDPFENEGLESVVWLDGETIPALLGQRQATDLEFSADGKHFAYTALLNVKEHADKVPGASSHDVHVRVIDGRPGPMVYLDYQVQTYEHGRPSQIKVRMYPTTFGDDGSAGYFARHARGLYRIQLPAAVLAGMPDMKALVARAGEAADRSRADAEAKEKTKADAAMKEQERARSADPFRILHEFSEFEPDTGFVIEGPDDRLYGGEIGGRFNVGQLFSMKKDGSDYRVLRSFEGDGEKGVKVNSLFFDGSGTLYGTTKRRLYRSDPACAGALFQYGPAKDAFETLYACAGEQINGAMDLIQDPLLAAGPKDGKLFISAAGAMGHRVVRYDVTARKPEVVFDASYPSATTVQWNGTKLLSKPPTWQESTAWQERHQGKIPEQQPLGYNLMEFGGKLYSVFPDGGRGEAGRVVSLNADGTGYSVIYDFALSDPVGGKPKEWLVGGDDGRLYGVTEAGGAHGQGAVFSLSADGKDCKLLCPITEKSNIVWSLAVAGGQAYFGSHYGLWKAGKSGEDPVHLKEMDRADSLFLSKDGHLYGATMDGGPKFHGYVFSFRLPK